MFSSKKSLKNALHFFYECVKKKNGAGLLKIFLRSHFDSCLNRRSLTVLTSLVTSPSIPFGHKKKTFFFLHFSFCLFLSFFCKSLFALLSKKWTEQVPLLLRSKDLAGVKKNFDRPIFAQTVFEERPHHFTSLQFASQSLLLNKKVDRRVSLSVSSFT